MPPFRDNHQKEVELHGVRAEFRTALREELEASRRASASGAVQLVNGRRIAQVGGSFQYLFLVESALNVPDDSPGDLYVQGGKPVETTIISVDGLAVTLSVRVFLLAANSPTLFRLTDIAPPILPRATIRAGSGYRTSTLRCSSAQCLRSSRTATWYKSIARDDRIEARGAS